MTDHRTDRKLFIETLIKHHTRDGVFGLVTQTRGGFILKEYHPRAFMGATHISGATYGEEKSPSYDGLYRGDRNVVEVLFIGLDDVGTKAKALGVKVTARVETKPGNFTDYVRFNPPATLEQADTILHSLKSSGYVDESCSEVTRVNRLPGSKPGKKTDTAVLRYLDEDIEYDPATFLATVGVAEVARSKAERSGGGTPYPPGIGGDDEVLDWLEANGHVQGPDTEKNVYRIHCPWHGAHTDPSDETGAKYFSCEERYERGFNCFHNHNDTIAEFLAWVKDQGGPDCGVRWSLNSGQRDLTMLVGAGITGGAQALEGVEESPSQATERVADEWQDILDDVLGRYVWYAPKGQLFDLKGPAHYPLHVLPGVKGVWAPFDNIVTGPRGGVTRVSPIAMWLDMTDKKVTHDMPHMDPRKAPGWNGVFINLYRPFVPVAADRRPTEFLQLVKNVAPRDYEWLLDWMAYKVQNPWARMVCVVSVTPTQGTGRNTLMHIFRALLGASNCTNMSASRLFGREDNRFNAHLTKLLITVGEIEGDVSGDEHRTISKAVYNKLKELVDPNERFMNIERKGADGVDVEIFATFFMATNAGNGLPMDKGDRRFSVLAGGRQDLELAHPHLKPWLHRIHDNDDVAELSAIHHMLAVRDVSRFNPDKPLNTDAKARMVEEGKNDVDHAIEAALKDLPVFTVNGLLQMIRNQFVNEMPIRELKRQVKGWSGSHSQPPDWTNAQGTMKHEGMTVRPRVTMGEEHIVSRNRVDLDRFMAALKSAAVGVSLAVVNDEATEE